MEVQTQVKAFVERRPKVIGAYSSGINQQKYNGVIKSDIDLILVVDDIQKWHLENIECNPNDYSCAGKIFYTSASKEKIKGFTGISYQYGVKHNNISLLNNRSNQLEEETNTHYYTYNYGVVEYRDLERQLCSWNRLSLASKFKNVDIEIYHSDKVEELIMYNKINLLATALILLGEKSTLYELYYTMQKLTKTKLTKEQDIIQKQEFIKLYGNTNSFYEVLGEDIIINRKVIETYFLPAYLVNSLSGISKDDLLKRKQAIIDFFEEKYKQESYYQALQDIKTNGIIRSTEYMFQKLKKKIY